VDVLAGTRSIVIFLQESGLTAVQAQRIVNQHGVETQSIIMADPYRAMLGGAISFKYRPESRATHMSNVVCAQ
jgi:hypothetical protein